MLVVDTSTRPDVADLFRLVGDTDAGHGWADWTFEGSMAILRVKVERPVVCSFRLEFSLDVDRAFLQGTVEDGLVAMIDAESPSGTLVYALVYVVPTEQLREALASSLYRCGQHRVGHDPQQSEGAGPAAQPCAGEQP